MLYGFARGICRGIFKVFFRWQINGKENIPLEGPVLLVSNHISLLDPPLVGSPLERKVHFMAKAELFKVPGLKQLIADLGAFPVKRGSGDRAALRTVFKLLDDGKVLGLFPEGTRSKTGELEAGQSGAAVFALRSKATVIPTAVVGPYRLFRPIRVYYGSPVDLSPYLEGKPNKEAITAATHDIMNAIDKLIEQHRTR
jgi:1-acyl-sn-glycerol-3-phosphate acyltransferase